MHCGHFSDWNIAYIRENKVRSKFVNVDENRQRELYELCFRILLQIKMEQQNAKAKKLGERSKSVHMFMYALKKMSWFSVFRSIYSSYTIAHDML